MKLSSLKTAMVVLFVLVGIARADGATIVPMLDLNGLTKKADVIVVGTLTSVYEGGQVFVDRASGKVSACLMYGEIGVDRILKGQSDLRTIAIRYSLPDTATSIGYRDVELGSYRVFFLELQGEHYEFVSPFEPSVVAAPVVRVQAQSVYDRVVETVAAVLRSGATSVDAKLEAVSVLRMTHIPILGTTPNRIAVAALRLGLKESDTRLRHRAAGALLAANDISALPLAEEVLLGDPNGAPEVEGLWFGIAQGLKDEAAIPSLARLLDAAEVETRRAASSALGHTRSAFALGHLSRALDDIDLEVRFAAVRGLAETTGQAKWATSWDDFRVNEGRYVQYWKDWMGRR